MSVVTRKTQGRHAQLHVKYKDGDGKQHWEQFDREKEADARDAEVKTEKARNRRWSPSADVRFDEYAQQWLDSYAAHAVKRASWTATGEPPGLSSTRRWGVRNSERSRGLTSRP